MTVRGTVTRMSAIRPLVTDMEFACAKCGALQRVAFPEGRFAPPASCPGEGCRSRSFAAQLGSARSVDWQKIRVQVRGIVVRFPMSCSVLVRQLDTRSPYLLPSRSKCTRHGH